MNGRKTAIAAALAALGALAVLHGATTQGKSFVYLAPAFTQELFASTSTNNGSFYLGGVAVLPSGDVIAAECVSTGTRLHRFSGALTFTKHGTAIHVETILPSAGGCGVVYHPDGTLYLNMNDGVHGVANVNATTGALIRHLGTPGNAVGIAVDPMTRHIVYASSTCTPLSTSTTCTLIDLDTLSGVTTNRMVFPAAIVKFVNGIYLEPTGAFLFLSNRFPIPRVTVVTSTGAIVQHLRGGSDPVGIGFSATSRLLDLEDSSLIGRVFAGGDIEVGFSTIKPQ